MTEPHDLPIQFLSETGIVGAALLAATALALLRGLAGAAAGRSSRWR